MYVILDESESYNSISDKILQNNCIKNYKKYIENMFIERYFENMNKNDCKKEQNDVQIKLIKRTCYFPPCLNSIIGSNNYYSLHNKNFV